MANYHLHAKVISRGGGRSVVAAAAYRHGTTMIELESGETFDYEAKDHVAYTQIMIPEDSPAWLAETVKDKTDDEASEAIWNKVQALNKKDNAQLAREIEFSLPVELSTEQNIELAKAYAKTFTDRGHIADIAFHDNPGNPHIHMLLTLAPLTDQGFGPKNVPVLDENGNQLKRTGSDGYERGKTKVWAGEFRSSLVEWRTEWANLANEHLAEAGIDQQIDARSYAERALPIEPTKHFGMARDAMRARDIPLLKPDENAAIRGRNIQLLFTRPEVILDLLTQKQSVFTREDIEKAVSTQVDDPDWVKSITSTVLESPSIAPMALEKINAETGEIEAPAQFSTMEMVRVERDLIDRSTRLSDRTQHPLKRGLWEQIEAKYSDPTQVEFTFNDETMAALHHVTSSSGMSPIVGYAGAGKSTLIGAASEAWKRSGYQVHGIALAATAAKELADKAQIPGKTIASFLYSLDNGHTSLSPKSIVVLDEAGMVDSRTMGAILAHVEKAGAKIVPIGDPDQLPAISAGAAFRAILERTNHNVLSHIYRQGLGSWQSGASLDLAKGDIPKALKKYEEKGRLYPSQRRDEGMQRMANFFAKDYLEGHKTIALAQSNKDVLELNDAIRARVLPEHILASEIPITVEGRDEETDIRKFANTDQIVFLKNNKTLDVTNGTRAQIIAISATQIAAKTEQGQIVTFDPRSYRNFNHGYALTVHKSQGATVPRVHVWATRAMKSALAYVALTRHSKHVSLHYSRGSFLQFAKDGSDGLAEALSRIDHKNTTLDYEQNPEYKAIVGFGERRELKTTEAVERAHANVVARMAAKLNRVWSRFTREIEAFKLSPELPGSEPKGSAELRARSATTKHVNYQASLATLSANLGYLYKDPAPATNAIASAAAKMNGDARLIARKIARDPTKLATLSETTAGFSKLQLSQVTHQILSATEGLCETQDQIYFRELSAAQRVNKQMNVRIPPLSHSQQKLLHALSGLAPVDVDQFTRSLPDSAWKDVKQIYDFRVAIQARMGPKGIPNPQDTNFVRYFGTGGNAETALRLDKQISIASKIMLSI